MQSAAIQNERRLLRWSASLADFAPPVAPPAASWLAEPGLLTDRLRACCSGKQGLTVVAEREAPLAAAESALLQAPGSAAFVREIELTCDGRPWVFAQTLIPLATLARHGWLSTLGDAALGERLAAVPGIQRGPLEFARLRPGIALFHRALRESATPPAELWARRSWFAIDGNRLLVQEVFLPESLR
ncbi:MAG TPA: chorismate lyase [Burkholderiales bacterium]|nr:chorismate lyase [Burkholderiales bacterium]